MIKLKNIIKRFSESDNKFTVFDNFNLQIYEGEFVAIMGSSGSGKSTLMNIIGCLSGIDDGQYLFKNIDISDMSDDRLSFFRNSNMGFIFQGFHLHPRKTVLENILYPTLFNGKKDSSSKERALNILKSVNLEQRVHLSYPRMLSGGQKQRVAIARALINQPMILLADEPTGNLDSKTTMDIMELFKSLHKKGITIILVTHEIDVASYASRIIDLKDGVVIRDTGLPGPKIG